MTTVLESKNYVAKLSPQLAELSRNIRAKGISPRLDIILVGQDPASELFITRKQQLAKKIGMVTTRVHKLPTNSKPRQIAALLTDLSQDQAVHGVILQLPLPPHLQAAELVRFLNPEQDVDGLTYFSLGSTIYGNQKEFFQPCAAQVALLLLKSVFTEPLAGKAALVIGHSTLVGRPLAELLLHQQCTVTVAHKQTTNLQQLVANAEIIISATGVRHLLQPAWFNQRAVVIDIGTCLEEGKLYGDVDYQSLVGKVRAVSPVPGGVGPLTVSLLMLNVLRAAWRQLGKNHRVYLDQSCQLVVKPEI